MDRATECYECYFGEYAPTAGAFTCDLCEPGRYQVRGVCDYTLERIMSSSSGGRERNSSRSPYRIVDRQTGGAADVDGIPISGLTLDETMAADAQATGPIQDPNVRPKCLMDIVWCSCRRQRQSGNVQAMAVECSLRLEGPQVLPISLCCLTTCFIS